MKHFLLLLIFIAIFFSIGFSSDEWVSSSDWREDWELVEGFDLEIDSIGFELPTSITFVENPGPDPKDPLYFVTELRGRIKVVTNDRTVFTFAERFSTLDPNRGFKDFSDQYGLTGLCLDPKNGYIFVTLAYLGKNQQYFNQIIRFTTIPKTYSREPAEQIEIAPFLNNFPISVNHQIGSCQVVNDQLFVGLGDGQSPAQSQNLNSPLGKILRLSFDGNPLIENPFSKNLDQNLPINYVWAYGFRNPFGIHAYKNRIFITENGINNDRFTEVQAGINYLWSGSDLSIKTNSDLVISPALSPTNIVYIDDGAEFFPKEMTNSFYIGLAGKLSLINEFPKPEGIYMVKYDQNIDTIIESPSYLLRNRKEKISPIIAIAGGKDGLYFSPMLSNEAGETPVYKIYYAPLDSHPYTIRSNPDPQELITSYGCLNCHVLGGRGNLAAPNLDQSELIARLENRLNSDLYLMSLDEMDNLNSHQVGQRKELRDQIRKTKMPERIRLWVIYQLMDPGFDNQHSQMPNLNMPENDAEILANYLISEPPLIESIKKIVRPLFPNNSNWAHIGFSFLAGVFFTAFIGIVGNYLKILIRNRSH